MNTIDILFNKVFSNKIQKQFEKFILILAASGFVIHLALIFLNTYGIIEITVGKELLNNPISALYTPFSFILVYEAFLLIYYLPNSFTVSVVRVMR